MDKVRFREDMAFARWVALAMLLPAVLLWALDLAFEGAGALIFVGLLLAGGLALIVVAFAPSAAEE